MNSFLLADCGHLKKRRWALYSSPLHPLGRSRWRAPGETADEIPLMGAEQIEQQILQETQAGCCTGSLGWWLKRSSAAAGPWTCGRPGSSPGCSCAFPEAPAQRCCCCCSNQRRWPCCCCTSFRQSRHQLHLHRPLHPLRSLPTLRLVHMAEVRFAGCSSCCNLQS